MLTVERDMQTTHVYLTMTETQTGPDWTASATVQTEEMRENMETQTLPQQVADRDMQTVPPPQVLDQYAQAATMTEVLVAPSVLFENKDGVHSFRLAHLMAFSPRK